MALCGGDHKKLLTRINRIEGQVRGLRKMVREDQDCFAVLKQIAATSGAIKGLGLVILEHHLRGCVSDAIREHRGKDVMIDQVMEVFSKFGK